MDFRQVYDRMDKRVYIKGDLEKVFEIMSMVPRFANMGLRHIRRLIIPPLTLGQYEIYEEPVCFASWALLSDRISEGYKTGTYNLQSDDWNTGENLWLINILCPEGGGSASLRRLDRMRKEMGLPDVINYKRLGNERVNNVQRI